MKIRNEKGSITIYALVAMFFLLTIIAGRYVLANRNLKTQYDAIAKMKNVYSQPREYGKNYRRRDFTTINRDVTISFTKYKNNTSLGSQAISFDSQASKSAYILEDLLSSDYCYVLLEYVNGRLTNKIDIERDFLKSVIGDEEESCPVVQIDDRDYLKVKISKEGAKGTVKYGTKPINIFNHEALKFFIKQKDGEVFYTYQVGIYYTYDSNKFDSNNDRMVLVDRDKDEYILKSDIYLRFSDYDEDINPTNVASLQSAGKDFVASHKAFFDKLDFNNHVIILMLNDKKYFSESESNFYTSSTSKAYIYYDTATKSVKVGKT